MAEPEGWGLALLYGFGFALGQCPSTGWDTHCIKPRAPQGGIITPQLPSKPQALPCFHLSLEEVILLLSWISGEGQPRLCSVGGRERAPGFPTHLLLRREINMHRAAHALVYSRGSQQSCAGRSHTLQLFWITVSSTPPLFAFDGVRTQSTALFSDLDCLLLQGNVLPGVGTGIRDGSLGPDPALRHHDQLCRQSNTVSICKAKFLRSQKKRECGLALRISSLLNHLWILLGGA